MELFDHFSILIYPFLHSVTPEDYLDRRTKWVDCWKPWWGRLDETETAKALDDTYFFLPYIRKMLFPETRRLKEIATGVSYQDYVRSIRQNTDNLRSFYQNNNTSIDAVWRITYCDLKSTDFKLISDQEEILASFEWVDAMLFASGVGFLMFKVKLKEDKPLLSQLIDLNYYLRMVHPPTVDWRLPKLQWNGSTLLVRDLIDFLIQGMVDKQFAYQSQKRSWKNFWKRRDDNAFVPDLETFINQLGQRRRYSETETGQVYGERCQVLSYACINLTDEERSSLSKGRFSSVEERLLFELAACLPLGDSVNNPMWIPALEEVERLREKNRISVWDCWQAMALKETTVFLATKDINFNKTSLPHNIEYDYLPLYLYTLFQKFQLFNFANELMGKGAYIRQNLQEVRDLVARFIRFRNQYWFSEVTRKPLGGELYRKFQLGLEIPALYELMISEVKEIQEYYEGRSSRRINLLLNVLTFVFLPLSSIISFFGLSFVHGSWLSLAIAGGVTGVVSLLIWIWWQWQK